MSLPRAYNRRIMDTIGARAVWLPGTARPLGTIVRRRERGLFTQVGHLAEHRIDFEQAPSEEKSLDLASTGTSATVIQAGAEVTDPTKVDPAAEAQLKLRFENKFEFFLKAPVLMGSAITNLNSVADRAAQVPGWDFEDDCIVTEIFVAASFSFMGTTEQGSEISLSGKGSAVTAFLNAGVDVGLTSSKKADVHIIGKGGPIAMTIVRVRKNGDVEFDI